MKRAILTATMFVGLVTGTTAQSSTSVKLKYQSESLQADQNFFDSKAGGEQVLTMDAGAEYARSFYLVLGSASGVSPGIDLAPGVHLDLNYDAYMDFTMAHANTGTHQSTAGWLNELGHGRARIALPAGTSPLPAGVTILNHAFVVLDPGAGLAFASESVMMAISN